MSDFREEWMRRTIALAVENVRDGRGGPFGALVVKDGQVIATGVNSVTASYDPTAHAEVVAIRAACQHLSVHQLVGCELYSSCEPCPMCLGAIYWARPRAYYFACTRESAAEAGFDDAFIYEELHLNPAERTIPGHCIMLDKSTAPFIEWAQSIQKIRY
ncbi:MAG: nucleoside deaminase [Bryobacteraceae bacterium]